MTVFDCLAVGVSAAGLALFGLFWLAVLGCGIGWASERVGNAAGPTHAERYTAEIRREVESRQEAEMIAEGRRLWRPDPSRLRKRAR